MSLKHRMAAPVTYQKPLRSLRVAVNKQTQMHSSDAQAEQQQGGLFPFSSCILESTKTTLQDLKYSCSFAAFFIFSTHFFFLSPPSPLKRHTLFPLSSCSSTISL